jgi:hypothetical protein
MNSSSHGRTNIALLLAILVTSAATMVFLVWRFPLVTAAVTVSVLLSLGFSARMATASDGDGPNDLDSDHGVSSH